MACDITRVNGNPVAVRLENGGESQVFNALLTSPLISSSDEALTLYKEGLVKVPENLLNNYPTEFLYETGEPRIVYKTGDYFSTSLRNVLLRNQEGNIEIGYIYPKNNTPLEVSLQRDIDFPADHVVFKNTNLGINGAVSSDSFFFSLANINRDTTSVKGEILDAIQYSVINETMGIKDGRRVYYGTGVDAMQSVADSQATMLSLQTNPQLFNLRNSEGMYTFTFEEYDINKIQVGEDTLTIDEFEERLKSGDQTVWNDPNFLSNLYKNAVARGFKFRPISAALNSQNTNLTADQVYTNVEEQIKSLGVSDEALQTLKANYRIEYGQEIGLTEYRDTLFNLINFLTDGQSVTELTSDILVKVNEGSQILEDSLLQIADSPYYAEVQTQFGEQYADHYIGVAQEEQIRRKAVSRALRDTVNNTQRGLTTETQTLVDTLVANTQNELQVTPTILTNSQQVNEQVNAIEYTNRIGDTDVTPSNRTVIFYSPGNVPSQHREMLNTVLNAKERLVRLGNQSPTLSQITMETLDDNLWEATVKVVGEAENEIGALEAELAGSVGKGEAISVEAYRAYVNIKQGILPLLEELKIVVEQGRDSTPLTRTEYRRLANSLNNSINRFATASGQFNRSNSLETYRRTTLNELYKTMQWDEKTIQRFEQLVTAEQSDLNALMAKFGSLANRGNPLLSTLNWLVGSVSSKTILDYNRNTLPLIDEMVEKGYNRYLDGLRVRKADGSKSEWMISPLRMEEGIQARNEYRKNAIVDQVRLTSEQINRIDNVDQAHLLARNLLVEILGKSSQSTSIGRNNTGQAIVKLTESEIVEARDAIKPTIDKINSLYDLNLTPADVLTRAGKYTRPDFYRIMPTPNTDFNTLLTTEIQSNPLDMTKAQRARYERIMSKYDSLNSEQMFNESYYEEEEKRLADPKNKGIELGLAEIKSINRQIGQILGRYRVDGRVDLSAVRRDPVDGKRLAQLEKLRAYRSNPYRENPTSATDLFKPHIYQVTRPDGRHVFRARDLTDTDIENMTPDDLTTWGIIRWNELREKEIGTSTANDEFIQKVNELEQVSYRDAYDFLTYNGAIGLNDDFYNDTNGYLPYIQRVEKAVEALENVVERDRARDVLNELKKEHGRLKYYNRLNRSVTNVGEVDYSGNEADMAAVRAIDERISLLRSELPAVEANPDSQFERGNNTAYYNELQSRGIEENTEDELEFMLQHRTDKMSYERFSLALESFRRTSVPLSEKYGKYLINAQRIAAAVPGTDVYLQARILYMRDSMPSYFTRYSPVGFSQLMESLRNGTLAPSVLLNPQNAPAEYQNVLRYVKINPRYDWTTSVFNDRTLNPNFQPGGEYTQLKKEKWINDEFFTRFGINKADYLSGEKDVLGTTPENSLTATRNIDEYEALKRYLRIRSVALDAKGMSRQVSPYRIPRISRTSLEKTKAMVTNPSSAIKEAMQDFGSYRIDETDAPRDATGKIITGLGTQAAIPRFFETELEDPTQQTEDVLGSLMRDSEQAFVYKNRREVESHVLATLNQIEQQQFKDGIQGNQSETLKAAKEYVDALFYGRAWNNDGKFKIGNKTIYLSKFFGSLHKAFSNTNLAYNIFVDITGMTTASITRFLQQHSNEYFTKSSLAFANSEATALNTDLLKESGNVYKASQMVRILETFGVKNPLDRLENSQFSRGVRILSKSPYAGADISNLTNTSRLVIAELKDHRLVEDENGKRSFLNYTEYDRLMRSQESTKNLTTPQIREQFEGLIDQSLYDLATFDYGVKFNEGVNVQEGEAERLHQSLYQKISHLVETADAVISRENRTWMQRNPFLRFMTTHKGWLPINIDRLFKAEQFNLRVNKYEAGRYTAIGNLLATAYRNVGSLNPGAILSEMQRIRNEEGNPLDYSSYLKYFQLETAFFVLLTAMGVGVLAATEDDDNKDLWALQFGGLIYLRTLSEFNSMSVWGIGGAIKDTFEKPFVSADWVNRFFSYENYSLDEVRSGKYAGMPKIWAQLMKLTIGKRFYDVYDVRETNRAYRHWNNDTLPFLHDKGFIDSVILPWLNDETVE